MTSREKVRRMFRGEQVEGMVIDAGGMYSDGFSAEAYANLLDALGMPDGEIKIFDVSQQIAAPSLEVVNALGGDFMLAYRMRKAFHISCRKWKEDRLPNGRVCLVPSELNPVVDERGNKNIYVNGVLTGRMPKNGHYYDYILHPLADAASVEDLRDFEAERFGDDEVAFMVEEVRSLFQNTDKAIVLGFGGSIFEQGQTDFGFENFYMNLLSEPELMHCYFQQLTEAYLDSLKRILDQCGDMVDIIHFRDDLGTQEAPQISPETYRTMIKPYHQRMFRFVHENYPNVRCLLHSCGAIFDLIPDLIDAGVDALNPVQLSAKGMDADRLKAAYGERLVFWGGGADLQQFVPNHTVEEIREHVVKNIRALRGRGNYVFTQIHNFQYDVPPEKICAIYAAAREFAASEEAR